MPVSGPGEEAKPQHRTPTLRFTSRTLVRFQRVIDFSRLTVTRKGATRTG